MNLNTVQNWWMGASRRLLEPVHPGPVGLIRIMYGIMMGLQFIKMEEYITYITLNSKFFLTYDFFHWVTPLSPEGTKVLFIVAPIAGFCLALGLLYRISALTTLICWAYIFFLGRGHYTNHYYLFMLIGFLLLITDGQRWFSLDNLIYDRFPKLRKLLFKNGERPREIPYWQLFIFKFQVFLVYFYGGIAKINWDWMQGYPMRVWLPFKDHLPFHEAFFNTEFGAVFMSWGGLLFDLLIGFFLFVPKLKWRLMTLPFLLLFHVSNHFIWQTIGFFPWFMIGATSLFFWKEIAGLLKRYEKKLKNGTEFVARTGLRRKLLLAALCLYMGFQVLFPLRHYFIAGDSALTGEGYLFAWRMMLVDRFYGAKMEVKDGDKHLGYITGETWANYINFRQFKRMCRMPKQFHRFAKYLEGEMKSANPGSKPVIHGYLQVEYNERPMFPLIDTTINLATHPYRDGGKIDFMYEFPKLPPGSKWLTPAEMEQWKTF